jgi:hypothetical protein
MCEHEVREVRRAAGERVLQRLEARAAVGQQRGDLAVDQRALARQRADRLDHDRKLRGPVVEAAGHQRHALAVLVGEDAVAVELLLVQPLGALGRLVHELRELELLDGGELGAWHV